MKNIFFFVFSIFLFSGCSIVAHAPENSAEYNVEKFNSVSQIDEIQVMENDLASQYCIDKGGEVRKGNFDTAICFINDGMDGIRCTLDTFYDQTCGHDKPQNPMVNSIVSPVFQYCTLLGGVLDENDCVFEDLGVRCSLFHLESGDCGYLSAVDIVESLWGKTEEERSDAEKKCLSDGGVLSFEDSGTYCISFQEKCDLEDFVSGECSFVIDVMEGNRYQEGMKCLMTQGILLQNNDSLYGCKLQQENGEIRICPLSNMDLCVEKRWY